MSIPVSHRLKIDRCESYLVLIFLFLSIGKLAAQIELKSYGANPETITIGDIIELQLIVEVDSSMKIKSLPIDLSKRKYLELVGRPKITLVKASTPRRRAFQIRYKIRAFAIGEHSIPSITLSATDRNNKLQNIKIPNYIINVQSVRSTGDTKFKALKPPLPPPNKIPIFRFSIFALILGFGIVQFVRKRRKNLKTTEVTNGTPDRLPVHFAHERAYRAIKTLDAKELIAQGKIKEYYIKMADIIRVYIADRFAIAALEMPTAHILDRLATDEISEGNLRELGHFFGNCDLVKFAKYLPDNSSAEELMSEAINFIGNTKKLAENISNSIEP